MEGFLMNQDANLGNPKRIIMCILEFNSEKTWVKFDTPLTYDDFLSKAREVFPSLNHVGFYFTDVNDAKLDFILVDYVMTNPQGTIIKIKTLEECLTLTANIFERDTELDFVEEKVEIIASADVENQLYPPPAKKHKHDVLEASTYVPLNFNKEKLKQLILNGPTGERLLKDYAEHNFLTNQNRKKVVSLIVSHLKHYKTLTKKSLSSSIKSECAAAIIELFPSLRNTQTQLGYEHFFDPETGTGYITNGLSNQSRTPVALKNSKKAKKVDKPSVTLPIIVAEPVNETIDLKAAIEYMQRATPKDKDTIIEKTQQTFEIRRSLYLNENFFKIFPRFIDVPELIDVDFKLLFPEINSNNFKDIYSEYITAIINVYEAEKQAKTILEWDRGTDSIIILTQLVPPTAKGKKNANRGKVKNIIDKLIVFKPIGTPIQSTDEVNPRQPKLIAVGANKTAISQYHIKIDDHYISLKVKTTIEAIDYLFKAHYAFNVEFDSDLKNFWIFVQNYFYNISSKCTNQMIDIFTKLEASKQQTIVEQESS